MQNEDKGVKESMQRWVFPPCSNWEASNQHAYFKSVEKVDQVYQVTSKKETLNSSLTSSKSVGHHSAREAATHLLPF